MEKWKMRKRLLLLCLLIISIFGFVACGEDPYANMTISVSREGVLLKDEDVIQLNITQIDQGVYEYDEVALTVKVDDSDSETDRSISIADGEGFVSTKVEYDQSTGTSAVVVKAASHLHTGKFALKISTNEGSKSQTINFNIDLKLESFKFKKDVLKVVGKGNSISLRDVDDYIDFYPAETTQRDITFELATLEVASDGVTNIVQGWLDGGNFTYVDDGQNFATISDGILVANHTYIDANGIEQKIQYPSQTISSSMGGVSVQQEVIVLKAKFFSVEEKEYFEQFITIPVVEPCTETFVNMNVYRGDVPEIELPLNENGHYDVVLLDPSYREGIFAEWSSYFIERELNFTLSDNYHIRTNPTPESAPVDVVSITGDNCFKIHAKQAGIYSHEFQIYHKDYPELFAQSIVIDFMVKDLPLDIRVNGMDTIQNIVVYDYYANSKGTRVDVDLNVNIGNTQFYVYTEEFEGIMNVNLNNNMSNENLVFANFVRSGEHAGTLVSTVPGVPFTKFPAEETLYLSHSFENLPQGRVIFKIGVSLDLVAESYTDFYGSEVSEYFTNLIFNNNFYVEFQKGLRDFGFAKDRYYVDMTAANPTVLCTLPQKQTYNSCIESIDYDPSIIQIKPVTYFLDGYTYTDLVAVPQLKDGTTNVRFTAKNGLTETISITTYRPTYYKNSTEESPIPLAIEVDERSSGYLHRVSGASEYANFASHKDGFMLYNDAGETVGTYNSVQTLFAIVGQPIKMNIYDYIIINDIVPEDYDITSKVDIEFNYDGYVTYSNGILVAHRLITEITTPIVMTIIYVGGYEDLDPDNNPIYNTITIKHKISIYAYNALQGVNIDSEKEAKLYVENALSYFDNGVDRDLSKNIIRASFNPNEKTLGAVWNGQFGIYNPLDIYFKCDMLNQPVTDRDGKGVVVYSNDASQQYALYYRDLFEIVSYKDDLNLPKYSCLVRSKLSAELESWIENNYGGTATKNYKIQAFLENYVKDKNYTLTVTVYAYQFYVDDFMGEYDENSPQKFKNINTVDYICCYSSKINNLSLNIDDDGVYFDIRNGQQRTVIEYTIDNADCINKEMIIIGGNTGHFNTKIEYGLGVNGKITIETIEGIVSGGIYELSIIPKDNVLDYSQATGYTFYDETINQTIRVKIADGTKALPFEIRSSNDFVQMMLDIDNANSDTGNAYMYYYYTLTRDISLYGVDISSLDIMREDRGIFSLSGKHVYTRNGDNIEVFNTVYSPYIDRIMTSPKANEYIGIFGRLGKSVIIEDFSVSGAVINLSSPTLSDASNIYAGILAGSIEGATIKSTSVEGKIVSNITGENIDIYLGGMFGADSGIGGTISGRPNNVLVGMTSTANNTSVEIEVKGAFRCLYAGGLVGMTTALNISSLQIVSNISTNAEINVEHIGGAIGRLSSTTSTISNLEISPVIVVDSKGSSYAHVGGVVGLQETTTIANSKVYFVNIGEDYSQREKLNIYVSGVGLANVGGISGKMSGVKTKTIEYTYVRSFYNLDMKMGNYAGNIFVTNCTSANVGGIVGLADDSIGNGNINIISSYFDADIMVDAEKEVKITIEVGSGNPITSEIYSYNSNVGLIAGDISCGNISNSYGIGMIYFNLNITTIDLTDPEKVPVEDTVFEAAHISTNEFGMFGGTKLNEINSSFIPGNNLEGTTLTNVNTAKSYAVLNGKLIYLAEGNQLVSSHRISNVLSGGTTLDLFKETLDYNLTTGENLGLPVTSYLWFYDSNINKSGENAYPILLSRSGTAMYDLVPTGIGIIINEDSANIYDISYTDSMSNRKNQMIMFVNQTSNGTYSKDYYEIMIANTEGSDNATVKVTFNGQDVVTDLVSIKIDDRIEIALRNNNSVLELVNNRIYARREGTATIEIRSYLDKTIKTTIDVLVVAGVTNIDLYQIVGADRGVVTENTTVYIDEISIFEVKSRNIDGFTEYKSTDQLGYIMEILDHTESGANGSFKINGKTYKYDENINNAYLLPASQIKVSGDSLGYVKFKLTPYIKLGSMYHEDEYVNYENVNNSLFFQGVDGIAENVYILDDMSEEYNFVINARAQAVSVDLVDSSLSARNGITAIATMTTTNVVVVEESGENYYVLLEDLYIDTAISNKIDYKILKKIELLDKKVLVPTDNSVATYYFNKYPRYEYELLKLHVTSFTITKTTSNPEGKPNTYDIAVSIEIEFNKEFYRKNADKYDLNTIVFGVTAIPHSNFYLDVRNDNIPYAVINSSIMDRAEVSITPASLTDILMDYYSRGEGLLGNTENTYPNDNASNFIIPGRDGLLKITLAEEFNNSSYVTVTLDKKYADYVELEQMAGVLNSDNAGLSNFENYETLDYYEVVETPTTYGIRLQKLSANSKTTSYFTNTYYVKVTLAEYADYSMFMPTNVALGNNPIVEISVTSYTIDSRGNVKETLKEPKVKVLTIAELPSFIAEVDGDSNIYMGVGVKKEITFKYKGLTNDVSLMYSSEYLFIVDDRGEKISSIELEYLGDGRKYYLCLAVEAIEKINEYQEWLKNNTGKDTKTPPLFYVKFMAEEYVWGVLETTEAVINVSPVEFEVESVSLEGTTYNESEKEYQMVIDHGESIILRLNFKYRDIVVALSTMTNKFGVNEKIAEHKAKLDTYYKYGRVNEAFSPKQLVEYALAGSTVTKEYNGYTETLAQGRLALSKISYDFGEKVFEDISSVGIHGSIEVLKDSYRSSTDAASVDPIIEINYTLLRGVSISKDSLLRISIPYHYDGGKVVAGESTNNIYYDEYIEFRVVVEDNSSDTHPTPIEDQIDLKNYASTTGHYILLNNIVLEEWEPIDLTVNSLDGNGYAIIIKSFNMSAIRANEVNAGIFSTIAENTLLKNITVDISHLLKSNTELLNDINIINNSTNDNYLHDQGNKIDLTFVTSLNFGILAGINNGSITNAKIVNTKNIGNGESEDQYLHVMTSQIDTEGDATSSNIGGLVGVNSATGAISNSFVGLNVGNEKEITLSDGGKELRQYVKLVQSPDSIEYHNRDDKLKDIQVFPFAIAGSNNIAGLACNNLGVISNSYTKGLGVYNSYPAVGSSLTAGLVAVNDNKITSSFTEGANIVNYRATGKYNTHSDTIEATGNVGGLVYRNNSIIENSYANVYLETQSAFIAGFVFENNGTISNSYSTSVNKNSLAYGQFTGVVQRVVQNFGTYNNCYYLVDNTIAGGETENEKESATPVFIAYFSESQASAMTDFWKGFSFATQSGSNEEDGIWTINEKDLMPKILTTRTDTNSFRILDQIEEVSDANGVVQYRQYNYLYDVAHQEGTKGNPIVIESAENFDKKIIGRGREINVGDGETEFVFGAVNSRDILDTISAMEYVRLVNNLNFSSITTSNKVEGKYLYETVFAGKLDGNGMSMNNLHIDTDSTQLENFGIFKQIGVDSSVSTSQSVIKNLNMTVSSYNSNNNSRAGVLAGTIINATIANVKIDGKDVTISATNMAGALAGIIYADGQNKVSIMDIEIQNITVSAEQSSIGGEIDGKTNDTSGGFYNEFSILNRENLSRENKSFKTLSTSLNLEDGTLQINNPFEVSYAGIVAGILIANNADIERSKEASLSAANYRTVSSSSSINNIVVKGNLTIKNADQAGGLFGYLGENTHIKNCKFVLSDSNQLIKSWNYSGGIVGENHGIIEQSFVAYPDAEQAELDATMLPGAERNGGNANIFSMEDGTFYNVAIGGIVGYSKDGVVIDSYSKANVYQPQAFIAGGLIGVSEGFNYLGYSYTTGAVFARQIIGGAVGLQITRSVDQKEVLYTDTIVALNDWGKYRDSITKILYDNYKAIYQNDTSYDNFYIKLPEIGNQTLDYTFSYNNTLGCDVLTSLSGIDLNGSDAGLIKDKIGISDVEDHIINNLVPEDDKEDLKTPYDISVWLCNFLKSNGYSFTFNTADSKVEYNEEDYREAIISYYLDRVVLPQLKLYDMSAKNTYVGSVVGKSIRNKIDSGNPVDKETDGKEYLDTEGLLEVYSDDTSRLVFSTTYGLWEIETGTLENGDRNDTYFKSTYNLPIGVEQNVALYSHRISYNGSDLANNNYDFNLSDSSKYMDKIAFVKTFAGQEYTEQLIGQFYTIIDGDVTYSRTQNMFKGYNSDRFTPCSNSNNELFVKRYEKEPVWEVKDFLPVINDGTYVSVEYVYANEETKLDSILGSSSEDKTYYLKVGDKPASEEATPPTSVPEGTDNTFSMLIDSPNASVKYIAAIRSVFIGESIQITGKEESIRPAIKFIFKENTPVATIFNFISGSSFTNLDIIIEVNTDLSRAERNYASYGVLANTIENVRFDNCTISIVFKENLDLDARDLGGNPIDYKARNNGLLFGNMSNSIITNTTFNVDFASGNNEIKLNNSAIENFGIIAGSIYRSNLDYNKFNINTSTKEVVEVNISKVAESIITTHIDGKLSSSTANESAVNLGGLIGSMSYTSYNNNAIGALKESTVSYPQKIRFNDNIAPTVKTLGTGLFERRYTVKNLSGVVGYSYNSTIRNDKVVRDTTSYDALKVDYVNNIAETEYFDNRVYVGGVVGATNNSKVYNVELSGYVVAGHTDTAFINVVSTYRLNELSIGGIVGIDIGGSSIGELVDESIIGSDEDIRVVAIVDTLAVGGLIGQNDKATEVYNAYSTGDITSKNSAVGIKTKKTDAEGKDVVDANGNLEYDCTYANSYLGGLIGKSMGRVTITSVVTSGRLDIKNFSEYSEAKNIAGLVYDNCETVCFAMGGLVGYMDYSSNISQFSVLNTFGFDDRLDEYDGFASSEVLKNTYVSGLIGLNKGSFVGERGYTFVEFDFDTYNDDRYAEVLTSAITNNRINSQKNVFYAQEFIGNNYVNDSKFTGFAMADLFGTAGISQYSNMTKESLGMHARLENIKIKDEFADSSIQSSNMSLPVTESLRNVRVNIDVVNGVRIGSEGDGSSRFYVKQIVSSAYTPARYNVIPADIMLNGIETLQQGQIISGASKESGKVNITLNYSKGSDIDGYLVKNNNGIISNLYLSTAKYIDATTVEELNVSLVGNENKGLITNVYVYERTIQEYSLASTNSGRIYQSATATIYLGDETEIYGLVVTNTGVIQDCYSANIGYTPNNTKTTDVYLVKDNGVGSGSNEVLGTIVNSFYYIPEILDFDNNAMGIYKVEKVNVEGEEQTISYPGTTMYCYNDKKPSFITSRTSIWEVENDHAQIRGIKDIVGAMVIHIMYTTATSPSDKDFKDIVSVREFKKNMTRADYIYKYNIHFYEKDLPDYNVVRVVKQSDLVNYIDSLVNEQYSIPNNVVVALLNNIEVSPKMLKKFSLSPLAMMVGLYHEKWEWVEEEEKEIYKLIETYDNATIDFGGSEALEHALIESNDGVLANIVFRRLSISYREQTSTFAPIKTNNGIISGVFMGKKSTGMGSEYQDIVGIKVSAPFTEVVSAFLAVNNGYVWNVYLQSPNIDALSYYSIFIICNNANRSNLHNLKYANLATSSKLYKDEKAYNG